MHKVELNNLLTEPKCRVRVILNDVPHGTGGGHHLCLAFLGSDPGFRGRLFHCRTTHRYCDAIRRRNIGGGGVTHHTFAYQVN